MAFQSKIITTSITRDIWIRRNLQNRCFSTINGLFHDSSRRRNNREQNATIVARSVPMLSPRSNFSYIEKPYFLQNLKISLSTSAAPAAASTATSTSTNTTNNVAVTIESISFSFQKDDYTKGFESPFDIPLSSVIPQSNLTKIQQNLIQESKHVFRKKDWDYQSARNAVADYILHLRHLKSNGKASALVSSFYARCATNALLRTKTHTADLSRTVRQFERLLGGFANDGNLKMDDSLSLALLRANGKAGNVGRCINLLEFRKDRNFAPYRASNHDITEFHYAIQSIESAGLDLRQFRNVYNKSGKENIESPSRWLDAILLNMSERGVKLDIATVNRMLNCFTTTGNTGRSSYWFYKVKQSQGKVSIKMNKPPKSSKIPSAAKEKKELMNQHRSGKRNNSDKNSDMISMSESSMHPQLKETLSFANSLTHGAQGHPPIDLDIVSYNTLMKACVYRGDFWKAMHIKDQIMPSKNMSPDIYTYNSLISYLSRVGDVFYIKELLTEMTRKNIKLHKLTVQLIVNGFLHVSDIPGAVSIVQDIFNQHLVLPPYTTHLTILEFALASNNVYEAKRHLFFIEQLWVLDEEKKKKRKESSKGAAGEDQQQKKEHINDEQEEYVYNSHQRNMILRTKHNPKLSKSALIDLFQYHGVQLSEKDFSFAEQKSGQNNKKQKISGWIKNMLFP